MPRHIRFKKNIIKKFKSKSDIGIKINKFEPSLFVFLIQCENY